MKNLILALILILSPFSFIYAQTDLGVGDEGLSIEVSPSYPEPYSEFTVTLNDYSLAGAVSGIKWRVDNVPMVESANQRELTLKAKKTGEKTVVSVTVEISGGGTQTVQKTITPAFLDIVVEPQTRTPAFYKGRSLPSIGSMVNLTGILNGGAIPSKDLIYTWKINNLVIDGGSLRGKNKITTTIPMGQFTIITLDVSRISGENLSRKSIQVPTIEPKVLFYEVNQLYGQSNKSITKLNLVGDSSTVQAEPYNLDLKSYNYPDLLEWKLDRNTSPNSANNPYEITLAKEEGRYGTSNVEFHVRNLTELIQGAQNSFQVNF